MPFIMQSTTCPPGGQPLYHSQVPMVSGTVSNVGWQPFRSTQTSRALRPQFGSMRKSALPCQIITGMGPPEQEPGYVPPECGAMARITLLFLQPAWFEKYPPIE